MDDAESIVEIFNDSPSGIRDLFNDVTEGDKPEIWVRIKSWIKDHQGRKTRFNMGL